MAERETGRYRSSIAGSETVRAFVPHPLPPRPPLDLAALQSRQEAALLAVGRLDSISTFLPDTRLFLHAYIRKEAVLSSQIEGTQSSLSDLLLFELDHVPAVPAGDVQEVSNHVGALQHGLRRLREGFPLSNRLIREIHGLLLRSGRGADKTPGEFRRTQNWIGGRRPGTARFVPPPAPDVEDCMSHLEGFLHAEGAGLPLLLRAGLVHVQFETIHPFLDGNGRVGRLLIALMLHEGKALREPLLHLSLWFKRHREEYYALLDRVRKTGDWETWLEFFLEGVAETAERAVETARRLQSLFLDDRERLRQVGRRSASALRVHRILQERLMTSAPQAAAHTGLSYPAAAAGLRELLRLEIVSEWTGRKRNRVFGHDKGLEALMEGADQTAIPVQARDSSRGPRHSPSSGKTTGR